MIGSINHGRDRYGVSYAILLAAILLMSPVVSPLRAQPGWRNTSVISQLWLGQPVRIDNAALPTITIAPGGVTYIAFSLQGGERHYYTKDFPSSFGTFTGFSPIFRPGKSDPHNTGAANLLAIDSSSTLHYVTTIAGTDTCLEYSNNLNNDTVLTGFSYLEQVGKGTCGRAVSGASIGADALGNLHLVCAMGDSIVYFRRSSGLWSEGIVLSDPALSSSAPAVAVSPAGEVHATFLSRRTAQANDVEIVYVRGSDAVFDRPRSLAVRDGASADGVAPVILDPDGFAHVAFVDQSVGVVPSVKYMSDAGGGWNPAETVVEDSRYAFGDVSLARDRYGAIHVVAGYSVNDSDSLRDGEMLYVTNANGTWSAPANITANAVDDNAVNQGNGFIALRDSLLTVVYTSEQTPGNHSIGLSRLLLDFDPVLDVVPDTIDFGPRYATSNVAGEPDTLTAGIEINNRGLRLYEPLRLDKVSVLEAIPATIALEPVEMPEIIRGGDSDLLPISLSIRDRGPFSIRMAVTSNGGTDTVVLLGTMLNQLPNLHTLHLDTAAAEVGSIARLTCRATPPLQEAEGINSLSLHLEFNPEALFPKRVLPADAGATVAPVAIYDGKGNLDIVINTEGGAVLTGGALFTIEFEGLLTGEPENEVHLEVLPARPLFAASARPGLVRLSGCEVGKDLGFHKGGFAERIAPNPVRDVLSFRYIAPPEVPVSVHLVDLLGTGHLETKLPVGTGDVQDAHLNLRSLAPGLYFIRLRVGDRVVTDTMIKE